MNDADGILHLRTNAGSRHAAMWLPAFAWLNLAHAQATDTLEEVTVTALRRSESILSVPASISALNSQALDNLHVRGTLDLIGTVPALLAIGPTSDQNPVYSLRGVSAFDYAPNQSGPIAVYTDGVYRADGAFWSKQIYDLERVEVLRGPQGTLYGKNATGGAINFIAVPPGFHQEGYLTVGAGNYSSSDVTGAFQTGLTDKVAVRVAFATHRQEAWQRSIDDGDNLGQSRDYGIRMSVLFRPSDAFNVVLRTSTSQAGPNSTATLNTVVPGAGGVGGPIYDEFPTLYPPGTLHAWQFPTFGYKQTAGSLPMRTDSAAHDVSLTADWTWMPGLDLISITSYNKGFFSFTELNALTTPLAALGDVERTSGDQTAEDVRLQSSFSGPFNYIAGLYIGRDRQHPGVHYQYYTDVDFNGDGKLNSEDCSFALLAPYGCEQQNDFRQTHETQAVYSEVTYALSDTFTFRGGLRYTHDSIEIDDYSAWLSGSDGTPLYNTIPGSTTDVFATSPQETRGYAKTTGHLGLDYKLRDGVLLYASLSQGFRAGTVNGIALNGPAEVTFVKPETLDAAELGLKGEFLEKRLQAGTDVFYYRYNDQQTLSIDPATFLQTEVNLSRSHIVGSEVEVDARVVDPLTLHVAVSYLSTRVDEGTISGQDIAGTHLTMAPKWSGNVNAAWRVLSSDVGDLHLFGDLRYVGPISYAQGLPDPLSRSGGYTLLGARLVFESTRLPLSVAIWGKNLADKSYSLEHTDLSAFGVAYGHLGTPRTYGAEVTYRF